MFAIVAETLRPLAGIADRLRMSPRRDGCAPAPLPSVGAFGVVQSCLIAAATGAMRSVSWNRPWNIWFAACAAGVGVAAANAPNAGRIGHRRRGLGRCGTRGARCGGSDRSRKGGEIQRRAGGLGDAERAGRNGSAGGTGGLRGAHRILAGDVVARGENVAHLSEAAGVAG